MSDIPQEETIAFYLKHLTAFLKEFFFVGNRDLKIEVMPRDCASGLWWEAKWTDPKGQQRHAESMRGDLMWERLIKQHLQGQREQEVISE